MTTPAPAPGPAELDDLGNQLDDLVDTTLTPADTGLDELGTTPGELAASAATELESDHAEPELPAELLGGRGPGGVLAGPRPPVNLDARDVDRARETGAQPGGPNTPVDWELVGRRYVEGVTEGTETQWPTLPQIAEYYGLHPSQVHNASSRLEWTSKRRRFQAQVAEERRRVRTVALQQAGIVLDEGALEAAKMGLQLCMAQLTLTGNRLQAARSEAGPGGSVPGIDALEQQRLAAAVDLWHRVGLRAIGDPEQVNIQITGADGGPVEISQELGRDDSERLASVLSVLHSLGVDIDPDARRGRVVEARRGADGVYSTD